MSDLLAQWLADEATQNDRRAATPPPSPATQAAALSMSGLAFMEASMRGELPFAPIGLTMDFMLVEVGFGRAVFQGTPSAKFHNPMGGLHGGWYATLLDSALGCAVHTALPQGKAYTTLEFKVNLVRAIGPQVQRVRAEGRTIHVGGQTATSEARIVGPDGKLYAHANTTCLVFEPRAPARG